MRLRYSHLDPDLIRQLLAEMGLRRLFNHLLLQSGGDVEEAMRWMRILQERGFIDENVDLDAFFAGRTGRATWCSPRGASGRSGAMRSTRSSAACRSR
jgi:hypothetical protein